MDILKKKKLLILTGPTAVGKSRLSIRLAKALQAEVISADSMQVYRGMDIGTDKISPKAMEGVPHHLIDVLEPTEPFNVVLFQKMAKEAMAGIYERGHIPLIVGGTGFYIQSVLYDIDFDAEDDDAYRRELEAYAAGGGEEAIHTLHERLRAVDPFAATQIHPRNVKRVIRALSFYHETGRPISAHNEQERAKASPYDARYFVLTDDRGVLYERINARVLQMMEEGLLEEVKRLREKGVTSDMTSMQGLGYREVMHFLEGDYDLDRCVELIQRNTRHFAKRQLTWFARERHVLWVDKREHHRNEEEILSYIISLSEESHDRDTK